MSVNSSSSFNPALSPSSAISLYSHLYRCLKSTFGIFNITTFAVINILIILPLCIFVLYLALQRWWRRCSGKTVGHSDLVTYHVAVIELTSVLGFSLICCGVHADLHRMVTVGIGLTSFNISGQMLFHLLTCVERYLAVVHPITYLSLRKEKGVRIRNISIGFVWLMCFVGAGLMFMEDHLSMTISTICAIALLLVVISFFSLSVLRVLIQPGPGEGGGDKQRVDQLKLRAFYTIMAILGVLLLKFVGSIVTTALFASPQRLEEEVGCDLWLSIVWFGLPSSLVSPLLFLQRNGKLMCCKNSNESGQGSD